MKLSIKGLALAGGVFWGVCLALWTLVLTAFPSFEMGRTWLELMVGTYPYYEISYLGALVGLIAGFIDGAVGLAIFGWLYNLFAKRHE